MHLSPDSRFQPIRANEKVIVCRDAVLKEKLHALLQFLVLVELVPKVAVKIGIASGSSESNAMDMLTIDILGA